MSVADLGLGMPALPNVEEGTLDGKLDGKTVVYVGETRNCEAKATMGDTISALYTAGLLQRACHH